MMLWLEQFDQLWVDSLDLDPSIFQPISCKNQPYPYLEKFQDEVPLQYQELNSHHDTYHYKVVLTNAMPKLSFLNYKYLTLACVVLHEIIRVQYMEQLHKFLMI